MQTGAATVENNVELPQKTKNGTAEHYGKWNKPGCEGEIPYDLMYRWNLINKTNKQAKYNQRYWNKEQTEKLQDTFFSVTD